jgi:hypothetical protein
MWSSEIQFFFLSEDNDEWIIRTKVFEIWYGDILTYLQTVHKTLSNVNNS